MFQKRTSVDWWNRVFDGPEILPVTEPSVSKLWSKHKALTLTSDLTSSYVAAPLDSDGRGVASCVPTLLWCPCHIYTTATTTLFNWRAFPDNSSLGRVFKHGTLVLTGQVVMGELSFLSLTQQCQYIDITVITFIKMDIFCLGLFVALLVCLSAELM